MSQDKDSAGSIETAVAQLPREWRALAYFSAYRLLLAGLVTVLGLFGVVPRPLVASDERLFLLVSGGYFAFSIAALVANALKRPAFSKQVYVQVFADLLALVLLMHASGGVTSGFGILLVVAIAGGSILAGGRIAILFAAIASLGVLAEQVYTGFASPWSAPNYPHAGILGAALFASAYLAHSSAQRLRASEQLAARQELDLADLGRLNEHIVQRMQSGILVVESDGRVRLSNKSASRLLGAGELKAGERLDERLPSLVSVMARWRENPGQRSFVFEPGGSNLMVQVSFASLDGDRGGAILFFEDHAAISQRVQQLKLASLGRLAGSIAHEIRNPLSAVSHANALLQESETLTDSDRRLMQIVDNNARRMNEIIESVLRLGRRTPTDPRPVEIREWLGELAAEVATDSELDLAQVTVQVEPSDLRIRADLAQIRQVLHNLCENGVRHAGEHDPGVPVQIRLNAGLAPDSRRPFIDVIDNGPGIASEVLDKLFEPFFTTRASGSGLGLYIARELCEANQATLSHRDTNSGCCFRITFSDPRRQGAVAA